jgi:hypothetical protein
MAKPRIYADFHNADSQGRLRLNCIGAVEDLAQQGAHLHDGMIITLYSDDLDAAGRLDELLVDGVVSFSEEEHCWVAAIDWAAIRHASADQGASSDANGLASPSSSKDGSRTSRST